MIKFDPRYLSDYRIWELFEEFPLIINHKITFIKTGLN